MGLRVILDVIHICFLCPSNNNVAFKINNIGLGYIYIYIHFTKLKNLYTYIVYRVRVRV
jgi:hypothetical protein